MSHVIFEPFRIKVVEPIHLSTPEERAGWIAEAGYNVFNLRSEQVMIDLLTDSGTSAMSQDQWSALMSGDESYAGSRSYYELERTAQEVFTKRIAIPVHQGRAGEHLVFAKLARKGDRIPSNGHFDTTAANLIDNGAEPVNLAIPEAKELRNTHPFKGNIDLGALEQMLQSAHVPFVLMTITNNTGGGQPVSIDNMEAVREICDRYGKRLVIDACRFAENAYFNKTRGASSETALEIAQRIFRLADLITFSAKKDALANIGGLVCLDDEELAEDLKNRLIITEGFPTYGGLAGRDLAAIAQGLREVLDESYLRYRLRTIEWMAERLTAAGVPVLLPAGGHAIYIEAGEFYREVPPEEFPGIALVVDLYLRGGIRAVELGNVCFGRRDGKGDQTFPDMDYVRLAMPRRVYTEAHAGFVVDSLCELYAQNTRRRGFRFRREAPVMRHFRSTFEPVTPG